MGDTIEEGDTVQIDVHAAHLTISHRAIVLHTPQVTGDSWQFQDCETGQIIYISEGCTLTKITSA